MSRIAGTRARWQAIASELKTGAGHPHLDRVRARVDVCVAQEQLEREIVREMASALGRTAEKLVAALRRLDDARTAVEVAGDAERGAAVASFNELRAAALRARHELVIHREAVGIRRNDVLETVYPIPAPMRVAPARP